MRILVIGGAGFIGSVVVGHLIAHTEHDVLVVDKLTYAGNLASLALVQGHSRYRFSRSDICNRSAIAAFFSAFDPDAVMNLAAESHIDSSIEALGEFINTNLVGNYVLLKAVLAHRRKMGSRAARFCLHHVSSDRFWRPTESILSISTPNPAGRRGTPSRRASLAPAQWYGQSNLVATLARRP